MVGHSLGSYGDYRFPLLITLRKLLLIGSYTYFPGTLQKGTVNFQNAVIVAASPKQVSPEYSPEQSQCAGCLFTALALYRSHIMCFSMLNWQKNVARIPPSQELSDPHIPQQRILICVQPQSQMHHCKGHRVEKTHEGD